MTLIRLLDGYKKKAKRKKIKCPEGVKREILAHIMPLYERLYCGIKTRKATKKELKQGL